ncbi:MULTISPECIES: IS21 family transposase [unclassified Nitrobacter]|uniref:IS21 family transposase n=1 Tax=unclassified Nitrobacter TaxID=2620411 RepID=UPI0003232C2C|nr:MULTISPECIES: IS21 family transposase [unclassified Nitrobacter]
MPRRKQARRTTVKDLRSILRLTYEQGLSVRAISERLQISKTSVATYLLRAREAGLIWPLPPIYVDEAALRRALFRRVGRPPQDLGEPDWARVAQELKRKGVTLTLLWQEYRTAHPEGYGYTWFCERFAAWQRRAHPTFRHRHAAGAVLQTDYAGPTVEVVDPQTGEVRQAQIFVAVLGASSLTFAMASFGQRLPDWIEGQTQALAYIGGVPKAVVCDNLKAAVAKALWFEPTLDQTFAAMAEHYDTTILPTRSRKPRDKGNAGDLGRDEWLGLMLDREAAMRADRRLTNRLVAAKLRFVDACIEDIDFASRRGLDRRNTLQLAQGAWLKAHENLILTGQTGTGKTWLACAFGRQAARLDHSVLYLRVPRLFEDLAMARLDGRFPRLIDKLARVQLLVLDDWGHSHPQ